MKKRWPVQALAMSLCCLWITPIAAQTSTDRSPQVVWNSGFLRGDFRPGSVSSSDFRDSTRIGSLIRAGQLYLSLQDAIALALENNLDLELERYGVRMATTDTYRAQGGGVLRGVPLSVNEAPAGIGGPSGSPLLTTAATGSTPQSTVSVSVTDTQLIAEGQDNLAVNGTFPFASGPAIPLFDPTLSGQLLGQRANAPQSSNLVSNSTDLTSNSFTGNFGYNQGFGPGTQISAGFQNQYIDNNSFRNLFNPYAQSNLG